MLAFRIIGGILLVFLLLGFLRLGARFTLAETPRLWLRLGPLRLTLYPRKEKKRKRAEEPKEPRQEEEQKPRPARRRLPRLSPDEVIDLLETALPALGRTARRACSRLRIDPLELTVVVGDPDPAAAAAVFGAANAAMFRLMPLAEERFDIPDPSLHLRVDFDAAAPSARGTAGVSLRVCDLFAIAFTLAVPMLRWYLRFRRERRKRQDRPEPESA